MTEDITDKKLNLEFMIDDDKWDVVIGIKPEFQISEFSWFPDTVNKKLYVGKFLIANLDAIKYSCWSTYHNGEVRNLNYF